MGRLSCASILLPDPLVAGVHSCGQSSRWNEVISFPAFQTMLCQILHAESLSRCRSRPGGTCTPYFTMDTYV
ncbi:hypothetical protein CesoFtcFv8_019231 [Champsocephalus esox]|uniref:Uncharacterized protein n=2 Tax=Champsocephalus TaxID=52236 RepID=A0AAN8HFR6_CHAGU|nr:hypothetical protein CesoFtcFv8_019231 [Champsocephalus esox]KAK5914614.1 hypothetical protein CgunFtcFv8_009041 [Champsocephalus gunnari]